MKIVHVSKLLGDNTNGIDYVVKMLLYHQNNLEGISASLINTSKDSVKKSIRLINGSDIIVFHNLYCKKSWIIIFYCIINKLPYIIFPHSGLTFASFEKSRQKKKIVMVLFLKKMICNAIAVHFLNQNEKENSYKFYSKFFIVPNGIVVDNKLEFKSRKKYISYLGRYDINHKGLDLLLNAIKLVQDEFRRHKFKLIMHGYDSTYVSLNFLNKFVSENNLADIVCVRGPITNINDKFDFLSSSSAYILTSRYEGLPITVLEALSVNTPCLVTHGTNMAELIDDNGFGISCMTNLEDIKSMLIKFLNHNEINRFNPSRSFIIDNFSWETISIRLIGEYKNAIEYVK